MEKFDRRVGMDTNERVKELVRNSMYSAQNWCLRFTDLSLIAVDIDIRNNVQVIKDDGISAYISGLGNLSISS